MINKTNSYNQLIILKEISCSMCTRNYGTRHCCELYGKVLKTARLSLERLDYSTEPDQPM